MSPRKAHVLQCILLVLCIALLVLGYVFSGHWSFWLFLILALGLLVLAIWLRMKFLRCPHCGVVLPRSWRFPSFCPSCGENLKKKKQGKS